MDESHYGTLEDGTPKDPKAYQAAIRADTEKMEMLDDDLEAKAVVLGDDMHAFQELIRGAYQVSLSESVKASVEIKDCLEGALTVCSILKPFGIIQMEKKRQEKEGKSMAERTIEAQRASAPVPR